MSDQPIRLSEMISNLNDNSGGEAANADGTRDPAVIVLGSPVASAPGTTTNRRAFLARASTLSLALPGVAAIAACAPGGGGAGGSAAAGTADSLSALDLQNANSRLDTALVHSGTHEATTASGAAAPFRRYSPELPPLSDERTLRIHWRAQEVPVRISESTTVAGWTFEGDIPGPIVHCQEGDTVEFTLTNEGVVPHSMDFHAAQLDPKVAFRSVVQGDSVTFTFKPRWAGAFMYHCGTAPVLMHIGAGMYGAIIVSPRNPLPPAKEFVLVQSEFYLGDAVNGVRPFDYNKMLSTMPDFVAFNGRPNQYIDDPIRVSVGDRVRFWVVNCGPTHSCAFHVVGEQFDTMYLGAPPGTPIRGVQTFDVPAGGGMVFELDCDVPGEFPFVNHGFGHGQKGSIGFLLVE
ncbi:MAG TPA: multicopper oxidase domain-containing protein [Gemmatimonadales bacterium]|nr:multicopper oxidase domain-containing protein [Gemmatimonadales bacterium]